MLLVGTVDQVDLVPYYQKADLLLLPSEHESFGMVMVEAMACGTPVAALKGSGGPDEVVEDGINGLLCNKEDFHIRILEYFLSPGSKMQLKKGSRRTAEEKWNILITMKILRDSVNSALRMNLR